MTDSIRSIQERETILDNLSLNEDHLWALGYFLGLVLNEVPLHQRLDLSVLIADQIVQGALRDDERQFYRLLEGCP